MLPFPLPRNVVVYLDLSTVLVGIGNVELVYSEVVSIFMEENGTLHIKKSDDNIVILPPNFQYLEIGAEDNE
jgi:pyruvate dehydrogenase complex dehydrogenase (E1) component